ncbi:site-specific integrase [Sunxiuqinia dokdonensis]|uniref:Integrase n=1 Tax=Sunxiuqinia dokdonensis TaxID=1409788 RepID=A0A0L8VC88_9BACT|nr:site-specific integrase [Sunxiuqinia dokdonensis]KOH46071.1 integrase [Sunxiuqinia dokdonensis]
MKTTHTFGIQFIIRTGKKDKDTGLVYARITVETRRIEISLKKTIAVEEWNKARGMAKGFSPEAKKFNSYLEHVRSQLTDAYRELQINKEKITPENIKALFLGDSDEHTLIELVDYHNTTQTSVLSPGTMKNYRTTKKYLQRFLKSKFKSSDIYLVQINYKFITDFEYFLRNYQPLDHHKPIGNNGVMKHQERFRKMINLGFRLGWITQNPFDSYKLSFRKVDRGFLTEKELHNIETKELGIERLQTVRDIFVFSCYTGLSYIDAINLRPDEINLGIDGQNWIFSKRQKTNTKLRIPLLPRALDIYKTYRRHPKSISRDKVFPLFSNQKLNSYLKEIADLCGIKKNLTFHLARHTFATTVTLSNGVPIETVSQVLGHKSISTTQIYAKVLEQKISHDMEELRKRLK